MNIMAEVGRVFASSEHSKNMVSQESSPGILVFSRSLELQYVNRRALELVWNNMGQAMTDAGSIVFSTHLLDLRDQIKASLDDRIGANIWESFEVSRAVSEKSGQRLLLRGFGHPDRTASHYSRIIIVLEEIKSAEKGKAQQGRARMTAPELQTSSAA